MINEFTKNLTEKSAEFSLPQELKDLRVFYKESGIPTILDESLSELLLMVSIKNPQNILELGTATGCSGTAMLLTQKTAKLTTIEKFEPSQTEAIKNFKKFGVYDRVTAILGDSYETALTLTGEYDFIFLDCNKASYTRLLPVLKNLLKKGGVLFTDNVLFRGYVSGEVKTPKIYNSLARKIREFDEILASDTDLITCFFDVGDGIAVSYKK
ncbi:MAG: O-methyltransferase [Clostridia bacterium]|jgi:predicted O-methyltransferase YrrM|nr:O-methyltransferase [Clostridia bacterium]